MANARTSPFLADCKRLFNAPIYKGLLAEHARGGEAACKEWLAARGVTTEPREVLASIEGLSGKRLMAGRAQ